jgi:hypothetical protein
MLMPLRSLPVRIARRLKVAAESIVIGADIGRKWQEDRQALPLTPAHRELYDIVHRFSWQYLKSFPDLVSPRDFNDRMQWLKLFDQRFETVLCSDKIRLREHVERVLGPGHTPDILQIHERFSQIDFDRLPDRFVIKANHDSGSVMLVTDKGAVDHEKTGRHFDRALSRVFGWEAGEWAYRFIVPRLCVERMIETDDGEAPADYKFFCSDGRVKFVRYISDRYTGYKRQTIDPDGCDMQLSLDPAGKEGFDFRKPENWSEMIAAAEALSRGFKFVRVDLYLSRSRILVGEMTFWPSAGIYLGDVQKKLGLLLDFDRTTFQPFLIPQLLASRPLV